VNYGLFTLTYKANTKSKHNWTKEEESNTFVSLVKDNDILSSNMPLAIAFCKDVRPKPPMNWSFAL